MCVDEQSVRARYSRLTRVLISRKLTFTTMESATAGQIASLITDTQGASAVLKGAFITYSNEAKVACGVPAQVIDEYGVYSQETALAMARACKRAYAADIGLGVTGTFGNTDPANADSVAGQVHYAIVYGGDGSALGAQRELARTSDLAPQASRLAYKLAVAQLVVVELERVLG